MSGGSYYARVPTDEGNDILEPTLTERIRDFLSDNLRKCLIPVLVTISLCVVIILVVLVAIRPIGVSDNRNPITAPPESKKTWNEVRLPKYITPIHYNLDFTTIINNETTSKFYGDAEILVKIDQTTTFVVIHAADLEIQNFSATIEATTLTPSSHEINVEKQYHIFVFDQALSPSNYTLRMKYSANLTPSLRGYYISKYVVPSGKQRLLAVTQFEATDARRAFPCFDEPEMKATFSLNLTTQEQYHALSNMPVAAVNELKESKLKKFMFEKTKKMSTYLVAFIVSDFESIHGQTTRGVKVGVYTRPGQTKLGEYALQVAIAIIEYYEELFGVLYPLKKSHLFAVPDFAAGAMENWGLITYRDTALLYDPQISSALNKQRVTTVIAHELGHQWFGNYVTMDWWDSLWLNEGFASFCEYLGANATEPDYRMVEQFFVEDSLKALEFDASTRTHSIHVNVNDPAEIQAIFDDISYAKGAATLRMLQNYLEEKVGPINGRSPFFVGLQKYLDSHAFSNAKTVDLWAALEYPDVNIAEFMTTWTEQPGYPLMKVVEGPDGVLVATQERFFLSPYVNTSENNQTWKIPFTYQIYTNATGIPEPTSGVKLIVVPASKDAINIKLTAIEKNVYTAIKPNVNQRGFFRVQLPEKTLAIFSDWLERYPTFLSALDRAGIFEDTFALMISGRLSNSEIALDMTRFLRYEQDYIVWDTALGRLGLLDHLLDFQPGYGSFRIYAAQLLDHVIRSVGWSEDSDDETTWHLRALLRSKVLTWGVKFGHRKTVKQALKHFFDMRRGKSIALPADVIGVVLDAGVMYGNDLAYDFVLNKFSHSEFAPEALRFLHALAQSPHPHLILKNLQMALSPKVRSQDSLSFMTQVAGSSPQALLITWNFIRDNWDILMDHYGSGGTFANINKLFTFVTSRFTSPSMIQEAERMFNSSELKLPPQSPEAVRKGLEQASINVWWLQKYGLKVQDWFKRQVGDDIPVLFLKKMRRKRSL